MNHYYHDEESLFTSSTDFAHHLAEQEAINESIQLQQQHEQQRREQIEQEAIEAALRASLQEQHKALDEALAASLHQDELQSADEEYATAVQESDHHATALQLNESMENVAKRYKTSRNADVAQGSWDCPHCTFTNPPYHAQTCGMCNASSPLHVLTFSSIPPTLRFGVEIEIIIPRGKADGYTLQRIAQELTRLGPPNVHFRGYTHETEAKDWKIVTDASIRGINDNDDNDDADLCFELVSPILVGDDIDGLGSLRAILDHVRRLGVATNATCGFHVHVDAELNGTSPLGGGGGAAGNSLAAIKRLCQCFCCLENAFDLLVASSTWDDNNENGNTARNGNQHRRANANQYCRSNRLLLGAGGMSNRQVYNKIAAAKSMTDLVHNVINPNPVGRYCKLNLTNIIKHSRPSTVEFRHHGGVQDLLEAEAWVRLILRFCQAAATLTNSQVEELCVSSLSSNSTSSTTTAAAAMVRAEVEALFGMVGCKGLEQYYIVERRLFAGEHRFRNTWTCTVCGKVFEKCQSLSQHVQARRHY